MDDKPLGAADQRRASTKEPTSALVVGSTTDPTLDLAPPADRRAPHATDGEPGTVTAALTIAPPARADSITAELEAGLGHDTFVLHGRIVPNTRGDVDHVIVAPSGVWLVDTKSYWGLVEKRDAGNWRTVDHRLFVNGRDQTNLVDDLAWQATGVRALLDTIQLGDVPVHPVLLFIGSAGRWFAKPIDIDGVRAMWTTKLLEFVAAPGPLDDTTCRTIATELCAQLPARD
ncbi:MAG: nuclease-related domain-containing protein [Actinobacteria bacterium]|nr:nuclease-related domain-containing protein [Actinomycetota bacterium]